MTFSRGWKTQIHCGHARREGWGGPSCRVSLLDMEARSVGLEEETGKVYGGERMKLRGLEIQG